MSVSKKLKEWYISIESHKFEGIADAIKEHLPVANPKYNNQIDSLVTRLTRSYMDYHDKNKGDVKTGLEIFELTCSLCDRFTESSNPPRLRPGIFHITRCLRELKLYSESQIICNYIMPGKIFSPDVQDVDYFVKFSQAWRQSVDMEIKALSSKFDLMNYDVLLEMIKFDFQLLKFADKLENHSKILFVRIQTYIDQIIKSDREWTESKILTFLNYMVEHIRSLQDNSNLEINPINVYPEIIDIMHCLCMKMMKANKIKELSNFVIECAKKFEIFIKSNIEVRKSFLLHLDYYKVFFKPVVNFDEDMFKEISNYKCRFESRLKKFGPTNLFKANSLEISKSLTTLFNYWLKCMSCCKTEYFNKIFFEIVELVNHSASLLARQRIRFCKCDLTVCTAKYNTYEQINIIQKCGVFICMIDKKELTADLVKFSCNFINEIIVAIYEYKETKCGLYSHLWSTCGQVMYNFGLLTCLDFLDESAEMMANLLSFIIQEYGLECKNNFLRTPNPLSLVLHKLSGVYYRAEKYREAMIVTAFNGLISYDEDEAKAFKMWASIKHKCKTESEDIVKKTMIACLKHDKDTIKELGVEIQLNDYNLVKLCMREIQGLQNAKISLTEAIKASLKELNGLRKNTMEFVEGVQYLGYHMIYFRDDCSIHEYLKKAECYLSTFDQKSIYNFCLRANLKFFQLMEQCNVTSKKIKEDIKKAKNILQKDKNQNHDETIEVDEVVPVYRTINMKHDQQIALELEQILQRWKKLFAKDPKVINNCWEPKITLEIIIIAGEVARLYLSQENERQAWLLAYELATVLQNHTACIYVTARSISLRYINENWIKKAHEYAVSLKTSDDESKSVLGMFWTNLADFYFETGKVKEAVTLMNKVKNLDTVKLTGDPGVYLDYMDTIIRNYQFYSEKAEQEEYSEFLVHHVYSMVSVNGTFSIGGKKMYYGLNNLLDGVNNMSLIKLNFISFREISAHLTLRLELAQSLGATLRVAECLKSLCYVDLKRWKLDDCEVKLQGIEQILDVEAFGLSMKTKSNEFRDERANTICSSRRMDVDDPVRDVMEDNASPILRKKIFVPPEFMLHDKCECYRCLNIPYQHLIFSCTFIRAQMYALKKYSLLALQHYQGALDVRAKVLARENKRILKKNDDKFGKYYHWRKYYTTVDYVMMLIDFSKFLMYHETEPREMDAMEIAFEAINICQKYNLQTHPVFTAANELLFSYRLQKLDPSFKGFTVPDVADIDTSDLVDQQKDVCTMKSCATPSHSNDLPLKGVHRKKTPPLLPLRKVHMNLSDSEDEELSSTKEKKQTRRRRLIIVDEESSQSETDNATSIPPPILKLPEKSSSRRTKKIVVDEIDTISDSMTKVSITSATSDLSEEAQSKRYTWRKKVAVSAPEDNSIPSTSSEINPLSDFGKKITISSASTQVTGESKNKRLSSRNKVAVSARSESSRSKTKKVPEDNSIPSTSATSENKRLPTGNKMSTLIATSDNESLPNKRLSSRNKTTKSKAVESKEKKLLSTDEAEFSGDSLSSTSSSVGNSQRRSKRLATKDVKNNEKGFSSDRCSSPDLFLTDDEFSSKK
ncbi:uncharacterized protein LOC122501934 [Leptopilina heterotoma]|uniref:uncharacterized protein LOC122501934 n=1 Tax=Leptopilina heterotoma TaxID=63436 RepID=UPI001CA8068C|nr:uncharacterized protein LOC122501934 [Leptopilina heterotoma]